MANERWTPGAAVKFASPGCDAVTVQLPGPAGGANWGGAACDPETGVLYVSSMTLPFVIGLSQPDANRSGFRYLRTGPFTIEGPQGLPLLKPPYGRITAIDPLNALRDA